MAKGNGKKQVLDGAYSEPGAAYFKSITIEDIKCFKGSHTIDLSDSKDNYAHWTIILGNNNTGKTTLLKCLAGLAQVNSRDHIEPVEYLSYAFEEMPAGEMYHVYSDNVFLVSGTFFFNVKKEDSQQKKQFKSWFRGKFNESIKAGKVSDFGELPIYGYGANRKMDRSNRAESKNCSSLFKNTNIANVEDWLLNLFLAEKLGQLDARDILELAKNLLSSGILPDIQEVRLSSREKGNGFENFVEFRTDFGWIRLDNLGYGYQTMIAWVLDLTKRMVERYPDSPNPLAEPAIVLVDEIDLHLHPDWQRRIIAHLTKYFPNTQFIATAHSPLIVQSAEEINLVILKKEGESVQIEQPKIRSFRGWTVEEIMTDLMQLEGQTMSKTYLDLMQQFDDALDVDDYEKAETAYAALDKILHPSSHQRKLLKLQMTSLSPADAI